MVLSRSSAVLMASGSSCRLLKRGDLRLPGVCDILNKRLNTRKQNAKICTERRAAQNLLGHSLLLNVFSWMVGWCLEKDKLMWQHSQASGVDDELSVVCTDQLLSPC